MLDKSSGVGSTSFKNPGWIALHNQRCINNQSIIDETERDLFGIVDETEQEAEVIYERFRKAVYGPLNQEEEQKLSCEVSNHINKLNTSNKVAFTRDEVVQHVEQLYKLTLGLPEEATRDEIKEAIASYLK